MTRSKLSDIEILNLLSRGLYRVDKDTGEVFNAKDKLVKPWTKKDGRRYCKLYSGKSCRFIAIPKLVWMSVTKRTVPSGF